MILHYSGRFIIVTAQQFRVCFFAQKIQSDSDELVSHLYESDWLTSDLQYRRMMMIFNENLRKSIKLSLFKTIDVDLNTFQRVS